MLEIIHISLVYHCSRKRYSFSYFFLRLLPSACLLKIWKNMKRAGYYLSEEETCPLTQGPGCINLHLSAHLSRSLTNPLWVHLRVLYGTHLPLS